MAMTTRLDNYFKQHEIHYQTLTHDHSQSSLQSGVEAGIPLNHLAKAVVLEDHQGRHLMAILPASAKANISVLNEAFNASFRLVKEREVYHMFTDCENGAVPPVGEAYHMAMVCDTVLSSLDYVYLEAGDHETLIKLDKEAFSELMKHSRHMHFSSRVFH